MNVPAVPQPVVLPDPSEILALQRRVFAWFAENRRDLPWRRTDDPYAVLVSEVMLQQTQVSRVVTRFEEWMERYPTLESLAAATLADVLGSWSGLGYNNRAARLRECALAVATAGSPARLPADAGELRKLPGIGPYTARAVMVFAHNADLAAVDANVRRVLTHELGLPHTLTDSRIQAVADAALPRGRSRDWHNALMDYGALVLTSRATGIVPRTRQSRFEGSRRQLRARLLRHLLQGPAATNELAADLSIDAALLEDVAADLERDGLVQRRDGLLRIS
jgi:A/G-specific adenine glycosylase